MRQRMLSNRNITYTGTYIPNTYIAEITDLTGSYFDMVSRMTLDLLKIFFCFLHPILLYSTLFFICKANPWNWVRRIAPAHYQVIHCCLPYCTLGGSAMFRVSCAFTICFVRCFSNFFCGIFCFHFLSRLFNVPFSFHIFCFYSCFLIYHFFLIFLYSKYFSNTQWICFKKTRNIFLQIHMEQFFNVEWTFIQRTVNIFVI